MSVKKTLIATGSIIAVGVGVTLAILSTSTASLQSTYNIFKANADSTRAQSKRQSYANTRVGSQVDSIKVAGLKQDSIGLSKLNFSASSPPAVPTGYTFSQTITAKSGQTIKGDSINGGNGPCITIPSGVSNVTIINCKLQNSKTDNGIIYGSKCSNIVIKNNIITNGGRGVNLVNATSCQVISNKISNIASVTGSGAAGGSAVQFNNCTGAKQRCDSNLVYTVKSNNAVGDCLSFYESSGTSASYMSMKYNKVLNGSTYSAGKAAGVVGDVSGSYQDCEFNIAVNSGMEGWQVQGGNNIICSNNTAFSDGTNPTSNVGFAYGNYGGNPTSNVTMSNNRSNWLKANKSQSDFWFDPKTVKPPTGWSTNVSDKTITAKILPNPLF